MPIKDRLSVVDVINLSSIELLVPLIDKFPELKTIISSGTGKSSSEDWDFFMTAAGVGLVLISSRAYQHESALIRSRASKLYNNILNAIDDFIAFMDKNNAEEVMIPPTVGLWVLWNLKQQEPSSEEIRNLAPVIGNLLLKIISDWQNS